MTGEFIVSEHPPFYLTSMRLLHHREEAGDQESRAIPLERLIGVEPLQRTRHRLMIIGSAMVVSGFVLLLTWPLYTAFLVIPAGIVTLVVGSLGKTMAYQIQAHNMPEEEEPLWQLPAWGADHFLATIRTTIGERTGF
jgi:hypothetical protein